MDNTTEIEAVIEVDTIFSTLKTNREDVKNLLWSKLRFRTKDYFHNPLYKMKKWDGYEEFFKKETGKFLSGLMPEIELALKILKVNYVLSDKRPKLELKVDKIEEDFLPGMTLRDFQVDYSNQSIKYKRGIIKAPTGAGKSAIIVALAKALPDDCPLLILTKNVTLVNQIYRDMVGAGLEMGIVCGKQFKPNSRMVVNIASIHKIKNLLPKFKALIVDEVHLLMSRQPKAAYKGLKNAQFRIGVSATPYDTNDNVAKFAIKGWFGPLFETVDKNTNKNTVLTTKMLQETGVLSKAKCTMYNIHEPQLDFYSYQDAVTFGIADNKHFAKIVARLMATKKGRSLILVERLSHGDLLAEEMPHAIWIKGETEEDVRKDVIDKLKFTKDDEVAIATTGIFNAGINVFIHNLVNAAGGKGEKAMIQRFGRGLRPADDKEGLDYTDFYFTNNEYLEEHSKIRIKILEKEGHTIEIKEVDF